MKNNSHFILFIFSLILLINFSCKKEKPAQTPGQPPAQPGNQSPIAYAGVDQVVAIPADTAILNGGGNDPDGTITSYLWTKISGPASITIVNTNAAQTKIRNLTAGTYGFELKVTDDKGKSGADTVYVAVKVVPGTTGCNDLSVNVTNGVGTLTAFGSITDGRIVTPAAAADKIVFGGGWNGSTYSNRADIYNLTTNTWSTAQLSSTGGYSFTLGNKIYFYNTGGYEVYDAALNSWSLLPVSNTIMERGPTITAAGNKIFFAGGLITNDSASARIDIYDVLSNSWSSAALSEGRTGMSTIAVGNKVFFAAGYKKWNPIDYPDDPSSKMDIYDLSTNTWSVSQMPQAGFGYNVATLAEQVFFTFENILDKVFIYNISNGTWSTKTLVLPNAYRQLIAVGSRLLIIGQSSDRIDVYNDSANDWSFASFNYPGYLSPYVVSGNKALLLINNGNYYPKWVTYDAISGLFQESVLNLPLYSIPVAVNGQVYLGGGVVRTGSVGNDYYYSCGVWKFQF
jgi:hypothetical protein